MFIMAALFIMQDKENHAVWTETRIMNFFHK